MKPERIKKSKRKLLPKIPNESRLVGVEMRDLNGKLTYLYFDCPDDIIELKIKEYLQQGFSLNEDEQRN